MNTAALIALLFSLLVFGLLLLRFSPRQEWPPLAFCLLATLSMSWLMYHCVRMPLDHRLSSLLGKTSAALGWIRTAYAPITEEPAKLWPLLIPAIRRFVTRENVARFALALGLGFALGEICMVAGLIEAARPDLAALPWYRLDGFISERFMTCATHAGMTALALAAWRRGPGFAFGLIAAMAAHYLANFPISMAQRGWLGSNAQVAQALVSLWVLGCFLAGLAWLGWLQFAKAGERTPILGYAICPGCGSRFARGLWTGLNLGPGRRYERCPNCKKWRMTNSAPA